MRKMIFCIINLIKRQTNNQWATYKENLLFVQKKIVRLDNVAKANIMYYIYFQILYFLEAIFT